MKNTMAATALSFLMAVGGGAALANTGGQTSPPSPAPSSETSGHQHGASATPRGPVGFAAEEVETAPWTVKRIDKQNRSLVLQAPDGTQQTVSIPAGTPGFDNLAKGDRIELDYFDAAVVGPAPVGSSGQTGMNQSSNSGSSSATGQSATNNNGRKVRNIRKVGHNNGNTNSNSNTNGNMGQSGSSDTTTNSGGTGMNHGGQQTR